MVLRELLELQAEMAEMEREENLGYKDQEERWGNEDLYGHEWWS